MCRAVTGAVVRKGKFEVILEDSVWASCKAVVHEVTICNGVPLFAITIDKCRQS